MTSAERIDDPTENSVPDPVTYAGPEWMGKANWHSVAESYLLRAVKPLLYLLTKLMLAINTRFPQVLLGRAYDGSERVTNWMPAVRGSRTEKIELPNCPAEWVWNETTPPAASSSTSTVRRSSRSASTATGRSSATSPATAARGP